MYQVKYEGKQYEFLSEADAYKFLQAELGFKKPDYDRMFTEYVRVVSNAALEPKLYNCITLLPEGLRDLLDQLRKHEWRTHNAEARETWQAEKKRERDERQRPYREQAERKLAAIKEDEQGRWLVAHPGMSASDFEKVWPVRLQQLEKGWRE